MSKGIIEGKIIGQCKNCYHFCIYKNQKKQYVPKRRLFCQNIEDVEVTGCTDVAEFGCWNWRKRKSTNKIIINIKV